VARVLSFLRAQETIGKYVIVAIPGEGGWRLAKVTGRREEGSIEPEPEVFHSVEDAEHAAFTARLREVGLLTSPVQPR
jgi:hypothetical protein